MNKKLQYFKLYSSCYLCIQQGFFFIIREFNLFVKYLNSIIAKIDCATYLHKLLSVINHSVPILFMGNPP